jgi:hypothetical protein
MLEKFKQCLIVLLLLDQFNMKLPDHILEKLVTEIVYQGMSINTSGGGKGPIGKRKMPRVFFLGKDVIEKINNYGLKTSGEKHIKLLSQGKKVYMFVSPLFYTAIKGIERGRSSYEKEWRKPELMKLITDIIPGPIRGKIKKKVSPSLDPRLKMHNVGFPHMVENKDQTGYWVPAMDKVDDEFEQLVTGLYENTMKKSELKRIIREEMGLPQPPVQVKNEPDNPDRIRKRTIKNVPPSIKQEPDRKISEVMVGGEMVDPNVVSAIMTAVPTLVALGAAINWKEEIAAWVRQMKAKYAK